MLLALSDVSIGFWVASLQSGFSDRARSGAAEASMNRCFAARQRRLSLIEPGLDIGITSPGAITWRLPAFISRYGLLICSQRSAERLPSGSLSGIPLSQTLSIGMSLANSAAPPK